VAQLIKNTPLISIITVSLNNAEGLKKTLDSILAQSYTAYESIVVDGGSTDHTAQVVATYQSANITFISENDKGPFDAMNKGAAIARGSYLLFLNSGDILNHTTALEKFTQLTETLPEAAVYYSNLVIKDPLTGKEFSHYGPQQLSLQFLTTSFIGHPSALFDRKTFLELGGYNTSYQIIADWLFFVCAFLKGKPFIYVNTVLSTFFLGGLSSTGTANHKAEIERAYQTELRFIREDVEKLKKLSTRPYRWLNRLFS
jgi:glycosyltransferase involved in cell wall biosynthesis